MERDIKNYNFVLTNKFCDKCVKFVENFYLEKAEIVNLGFFIEHVLKYMFSQLCNCKILMKEKINIMKNKYLNKEKFIYYISDDFLKYKLTDTCINALSIFKRIFSSNNQCFNNFYDLFNEKNTSIHTFGVNNDNDVEKYICSCGKCKKCNCSKCKFYQFLLDTNKAILINNIIKPLIIKNNDKNNLTCSICYDENTLIKCCSNKHEMCVICLLNMIKKYKDFNCHICRENINYEGNF